MISNQHRRKYQEIAQFLAENSDNLYLKQSIIYKIVVKFFFFFTRKKQS